MDIPLTATDTDTPGMVATDGTMEIGIATIGVITGAADGVMITLDMAADGSMAADGTAAVMSSQVVMVDGMVAVADMVAGIHSHMKATVADIIAADPDWASNPTTKIV